MQMRMNEIMEEKYKQIAEKIKDADGILIGASNGLSIAEGYNIFANNYWIGTVDEEDTEFVFNKDILNVPENSIVKITIEAFDYDGETSKRRASVDLKV